MAAIKIDSGHRTHLAVCLEAACDWRSAVVLSKTAALHMARGHEREAHPAAPATSRHTPTSRALARRRHTNKT